MMPAGNMKNAVMAIWKHGGRDHSDCGDWCPSHSGDMDRANRNSLPKFVLKAIKPVFEALSDDSLLSERTHGGPKIQMSVFFISFGRCAQSQFFWQKET